MLKFNSQTSTRLNKVADVMYMGISQTKDELGQYPIVETKLCTIPCGVTPQTGSMLNGRAADTVLTKTTHKVIIRYRADIGPKMWLVIGGVRYDILYIINPYLGNETLELFCEVKEYGADSNG